MTADEVLARVKKLVPQRLSKTQELVFREAWQGQSYQEIASTTGYDAAYIKDAGSKLWQSLSEVLGKKITKYNFRLVLQSWFNLQATEAQPVQKPIQHLPLETATSPNQDWEEVIDVPLFFGRTTELSLLRQWVVDERCQLIVLLGMGGIGKTALAVKLVQQIQSEFEFLIWRSLRNAPPLQNLLVELIQFLSKRQEITPPETVDGKISRLLEYLRTSRTLLVFDNVETILRGGERVGNYQAGYEGYGELLQRVAETSHDSCLIVTSREIPRSFGAIEGNTARSIRLSGLPLTAGQEIVQTKGEFRASEFEWKTLVEHYAGNPLALKIAAATIQDFFEGNISSFLETLEQGGFIFDDIHTLLERQFTRLSKLEQDVMYWLAINRELVSFPKLQADFPPNTRKSEILAAVTSLQKRSLIEKNGSSFTQQPVVMEYVTEQIIDQICTEITSGKPVLFRSHALLKAQAKDYVRESQIRAIVEPVAAKLCNTFQTQQQIEAQFQQMLLKLQAEFLTSSGYASGNIINLYRQLKIDLTGYNFSNLPVWQAYLQGLTLHRVNFAHADFSKSVFAETFGSVLSVAFSPDEKLLAASDTKGEIRLWNIATGQHLLTCKGHTSWILAILFSSDGRTLASCSLDQTIKLWDVTTGQCQRTLLGHANYVSSLDLSPNGQTLASSSMDLSIRLWDVATGQCLKILQGHTQPVLNVQFSPDGRLLASSSSDQTIRLWDIATEQCVKLLTGHTDWIWSVRFSPDGQTLASSSSDQTIKLWDISTGECLKTLQGHSQLVYAIAFNSNGQLLASGSSDQTVRLWNTLSGQCLKVLQGHSKKVWSVAFSPSGETLMSGGDDQIIKLWEVSTGRSLKTFRGHTNWTWSAIFSPDGKTVASSHEDGTIRLWNAATGECSRTLYAHKSWVWSLNFSPDGQTLISGSEDQTVKLWDLKTRQCLKVFEPFTSTILSTTLSPDGKTLAAVSNALIVWLCDINTGQCLGTLEGHTQALRSVCFSPNGKTIASSSYDRTIRLWDAQTKQCMKVLEGYIGLPSSVVFSPDGQLLIGGSHDQTVRIWDVNTGQCLKILEGHTSLIWSVAISSDGKVIASGSDDQTIKLWDTQTGECLRTLQEHTGNVSSVSFSPVQQQLLMSSSQDETIKLWNVQTSECLKTLISPKPYDAMNIMSATGLTEAQRATLKTLGAID